MSQWCRLWEDMPNDPKWRVIAKRSGRPVAEVLAVFVHMMVNAANSGERGALSNWSDEDIAIALDAETAHVSAIRTAMQGKTLEGERLTGWEKRQPVREDGSAERAKAWREQKKTAKNTLKRAKTTNGGGEREQTPENANERQKRIEEIREDKKQDSSDLTIGRETPLPEPDADLFRRGKQVLGQSAGGLIAKLKVHFGGSIPKARAAIEQASEKQNPSEYVAKILSSGGAGPPFQRPQIRNSPMAAGESLMSERFGRQAWEH